ncbi:MAG: NfeD family protein [Candidatus Cloacimonetes bacterium]|jgi:membrane protein implicated in regulation of membrane protease activity|nr:NfeD family protein [Candidatus Cloacimonadota bacterium]
MELWSDPWIIWVAIGIICIIIEIFTPGFLFLSFGVGAIITGLAALIIPSLTFQILTFAIVTLIVFILSRKFSKKLISNNYEETNVKALIGKTGKVTQEIPANEKGYVKIGGEEWAAVSKDNREIKKDARVTVNNIDGNKVIVTLIEE